MIITTQRYLYRAVYLALNQSLKRGSHMLHIPPTLTSPRLVRLYQSCDKKGNPCLQLAVRQLTECRRAHHLQDGDAGSSGKEAGSTHVLSCSILVVGGDKRLR